jgi:hypothetical protein
MVAVKCMPICAGFDLGCGCQMQTGLRKYGNDRNLGGTLAGCHFYQLCRDSANLDNFHYFVTCFACSSQLPVSCDKILWMLSSLWSVTALIDVPQQTIGGTLEIQRQFFYNVLAWKIN